MVIFMLSFHAFKMFITIFYIWFLLGSGIIGIFAIKELYFLIKPKRKTQPKIGENGGAIHYEM